MERRKLSPLEIKEGLTSLDEWKLEGGAIRRRYEFQDFAQSLAFVNKLAEVAEKMDHHPDITFGWGYAEIATTTHDRGGITDLDLSLAAKIDELSASDPF